MDARLSERKIMKATALIKVGKLTEARDMIRDFADNAEDVAIRCKKMSKHCSDGERRALCDVAAEFFAIRQSWMERIRNDEEAK